MPQTTYIPAFYLKQNLRLTVNRFELHAAEQDGSPGELLGTAQQKRMAMKEQVTFYADEDRTTEVFSFKARQVIDLSAGYDVTDPAGNRIGYFKKNFGASLLRTTFHVEGDGFAGTGQERSMAVALIRRVSDLPFLPIHFDFTDDNGALLFSVERQVAVRDRYTITVPDQRVDFRIAASMAVGLDVLMGR